MSSVKVLAMNCVCVSFRQLDVHLTQTVVMTVHCQNPFFFISLFEEVWYVSQFHSINDDVALFQWRYDSSCILPTGQDKYLSRGLRNILCMTGTLQAIGFTPRTSLVLWHRFSGLHFWAARSIQPTIREMSNLGDLTSELDPNDYICNWKAAGYIIKSPLKKKKKEKENWQSHRPGRGLSWISWRKTRNCHAT